MSTYEHLLQRPRRPSRMRWLMPVALALLAALLLVGLDRPMPTEIPAALPVAAPPDMLPPPLDHAALRDPARLAEPDPSPRSVAAYGD